MAASLEHEIKQPIAAAITSANSCIEWLAHEPPNLDRARARQAKSTNTGIVRPKSSIGYVRFTRSPSTTRVGNVNGIIQEILTLLDGEATDHRWQCERNLQPTCPKLWRPRATAAGVMNLMLNAIEAMTDAGGELR